MAAEIGVLVVHGMGTAPEEFAAPLIERVEARLADLGVAEGSVAWQAGHWSEHLDATERRAWERALSQGPVLSFLDLRRFVLTALGDAVAYRRENRGGQNVYLRIHTSILEHLRALRATLGDDRPLVVLAHSLGSIIMSDYIWNAQRNHPWSQGKNAFECMHTLAGLVTFGSTLPLFSLAVEPIQAIEFPPPQLTDPALRAAAAWHNYYDRHDILGWPIRTISESYEAVVTADHEINVGDAAVSWNPACHTRYWTDDDFVLPVAQQLERVVDAARAASRR